MEVVVTPECLICKLSDSNMMSADIQTSFTWRNLYHQDI